MTVDIGIMAYNEERNIGRLLHKLIGTVTNVYVIASGCTDNTVSIAESCGAKVLIQEKREGKSSAINLFLRTAKSDFLVLCSADVLPSSFCLKYILEPFEDSAIGMVGAHPIPVNTLKTSAGKVSHLLWATHHQIASRWPKMGELCAFRNILDSIDASTPVDEACIEFQITKRGLKLVYAPRAIVFNRGPETLNDFMLQRSRIYSGHLNLKSQGYEVPTMNALRVLRVAPKGDFVTFLRLCWLEYKARRYAHRMQLPTIWSISTTTKELT